MVINPDADNIAVGTTVNTRIRWSDTNPDYAQFYVDYGSGFVLEDSLTFTSSLQWFNTSIDTTGHTGKTITWKQVAYDDAGNSYTYSDSFAVVLNALNVYVYDERTGAQILPSGVVVFNADISQEATISESTKVASLSYTNLTSGKYIIQTTADGYYSRRSILLVDITGMSELDIYLPSTNETVIFDQFALTDATNTYDKSQCIIRLDKPMPTGTDTVFSSYFDFDGVASTYLIASDQYILYIELPDRTINYGWLTPDADGRIDIVIGSSSVDLRDEWISYTFQKDDAGIITLNYESDLEIDTCSFLVNHTNGTNLYTATSESDSGSFTYGADVNSSYYVTFTALSTSGKTIEITKLINWNGDGIQDVKIQLLPDDAPDWLYNLVSAAIIIISVLLFGQFRADIACLIGAAFTGLTWYWGWLKITGIVVSVAIIIAVAAVMSRSRRS